MAEGYVELRGVRTWYGEAGEGPPLVMLHPGGVDSRAFAPNVDALAEHLHIWLPERRGHGRTPDSEAPYSYDGFADDTIQFLGQVVGGPARLLGMSDGAIVGLHVALKRPDLVERSSLPAVSFTLTRGFPVCSWRRTTRHRRSNASCTRCTPTGRG